jgi:hypothetical protein
VILLRNLDPLVGLCNGTCLCLTLHDANRWGWDHHRKRGR